MTDHTAALSAGTASAGLPFSYDIIYSARKTLAIQIAADGHITVRAPKGFSRSEIHSFVREKRSWIEKHLARIQSHPVPEKKPLSKSERSRYMETARDIFTVKTAYYASLMNVTYHRISIREQKTRWGSCSSAGNLNFNWRLIFAPEEVLNYVVVHELAHRLEMNHSKAFYAIVEQVLPDYKKSRKWLRENGSTLWDAV